MKLRSPASSCWAALAVPSLLLVAQQLQAVNAWAESWGSVHCLEPQDELCVGSAILYGPSPVLECPDENGYMNVCPDYKGGWEWNFDYVRGLEDGTWTYGHDGLGNVREDIGEYFTGESMRLKLDDDKATCSVFANGAKCRTCEVCNFKEWGESTFSADCTNVNNGRQLDCEMLGMRSVSNSVSLGLFYPFGENPEDDTDALTSTPTNVPPVPNPFTPRTPTIAPTGAPTMASGHPSVSPITANPTEDPSTGAPTGSPVAVATTVTDAPTIAPASPTTAPSYLRTPGPSTATPSPEDSMTSPEDPPEELPEEQTLPIDAYLVFDFFQGAGREPAPAEIEGLLRQMMAFFLGRLQGTPAFSEFALEFVNITPHYDAVNAPDEFKLEFETLVTVDQAYSNQETMRAANQLLGESDFREFLLDFVRESEPSGSIFMRTFKVFYKGVNHNTSSGADEDES